jgi:hypothetical protein
MAILNQGFLGPGSGKLGGAVMASWKGIPYAKGYVVPANPNTSAQQVQRSRMSACVALAQQVSSVIITEYFNPVAVKMSGFNMFIKNNIMELASSTYILTVDNKMSVGSLNPTSITSATLASETVTFAYDDTVQGNGLATDVVDLIVINKNTNAVYVTQDTYDRDDAGGTVSCPGETTAADLIAFAVVKRGTGSSFTLSNSDSIQVST